MAERQGNIIVVEDVDMIGDTLAAYDRTVEKMERAIKSNNVRFNQMLEKIVKTMF